MRAVADGSTLPRWTPPALRLPARRRLPPVRSEPPRLPGSPSRPRSPATAGPDSRSATVGPAWAPSGQHGHRRAASRGRGLDDSLPSPGPGASARPSTPHERASVTVRAGTVDRLRSGVPFLDSDALAVESFDATPEPDAVAESSPPEWLRDDPQSNVEATMALRASEDAPEQTVSYSVTGAPGDDYATEEFDVAIRE